ncbi:MAG: Fe-S oxidoreductase [Clostridiales bacterium GWB2_37_7]|nr:MAG: Fe-S oxidoreductase [Clostridiales bacterium GWB2_37_7]
MKINEVHIKDVLPGSIAEELEIEKGDKLVAINGASVLDIIEYKYLITDEYLEMEIRKPDGEIWEFEIEKEYDEDLGIVFDGIIDNPKSCHNKCIFCFIDQMPKGMRETLYFKDDDTRLSFLMGNFITLTNMKREELNKIIRYRISPINVSVHTTNPELRKEMLNNKNAVKIMDYLKLLTENDIEVKAQIVLCSGVNDGAELERTLRELSEMYPSLSTTAIVPIGLTKYREGLYHLKEITKEKAKEIIIQVEAIQKEFLKKLDTRFSFLSDEFYLIAEKPLPEYDTYEDFKQLDNGVGLITLFRDEIKNSLKLIKKQEYCTHNKKLHIVTGRYAYPIMLEAVESIKNKIPNLDLDVTGIDNDFFGHSVKVSGLITGQDIISQMKDKLVQGVENILLIPDSMLRKGEVVMLDDITMTDIEKQLNVRMIACREEGSDLIEKILSIL